MSDSRGRPFFTGSAALLGLAIATSAWITQADLWEWAESLLIGVAILLTFASLALMAAGAIKSRKRRRNATAVSRVRDRAGQLAGADRLFSIRVPERPRIGHIEGREAVFFPLVLITRYGVSRPLRFSLSMTGRSFVGFDRFQEIYQDSPQIHAQYFSNPLDVDWNHRQANLAFIHAPGSAGLGDSFEIQVHDMLTGHRFIVTSTGEHTFMADGSSQVAPLCDAEADAHVDEITTTAPRNLQLDSADAWSDDGSSFTLRVAVRNDGPSGAFSGKVMKVAFVSVTGRADFRIPEEPWFARWKGCGEANRIIRQGDEAFLEIANAWRSADSFGVEFLTPDGPVPNVELQTLTPAGGVFRIEMTVWRDDESPLSWKADLSVSETGRPQISAVEAVSRP